MHLILNNLRSAVDAERLTAGKLLAVHLCGHLGPAGVRAEGGRSWEVLTGLTGRRARIGVESLQGRHSFVLNYPFLSSGAGELVEIILQEKKLAQHRAFSAIPMAEEKTFPITLQGHQFTSSTPKINTKSY